MIEFLKGWGTLIVASLALIQPWALALYRKFFRQGSIDIYEIGTIEVGYSAFGATVGLHGTLRAVHRDQFVRRLDLTVIKLKDSSRHLFEWGVFRSAKLTIGGVQEMSFELPSGFMLSTAQPHRYNIQFFDISIQNEIRPHVEKLREAWNETFLESGGSKLLEQGVDLASISAEIKQASDTLYSSFLNTTPHVDAFMALNRLCYWEPGEYSLEMRVNTDRPQRSFSRNWTFELSENDSKSLQLNGLKVVQDVCGRSYGQYLFAYVKYQSSN